jgi:hypothetical protein
MHYITRHQRLLLWLSLLAFGIFSAEIAWLFTVIFTHAFGSGTSNVLQDPSTLMIALSAGLTGMFWWWVMIIRSWPQLQQRTGKAMFGRGAGLGCLVTATSPFSIGIVSYCVSLFSFPSVSSQDPGSSLIVAPLFILLFSTLYSVGLIHVLGLVAGGLAASIFASLMKRLGGSARTSALQSMPVTPAPIVQQQSISWSD